MRLHREILRLAGPSILANITVPLVGMVDIAIAGHLSSSFGSAALIGGISVGTMLFDLLYWNFAFLRAGTGGLTAQAYGEARALISSNHTVISSEVEKSPVTGGILLRAIRIALLSGLALIALQWVVVWLAFMVVNCTPEVRDLASQYFYIRIWAAPATLSLFAFKGWFIGMQDSVRAMTADLVVNGVNIIGSLVLALGIPGLFGGLGFRGIALGTVLAQWTGAAFCILAILARYRNQFARSVPKNGHFQGQRGQNSASVRKNGHFQGRTSFFTLNRDLFLRSVGMIAVYIGFTAISAGFGDMMLAASTIIMKLLMIFSYFTDGFAYAGEALTGRFVGEKSGEGIQSTVRQTFLWSIGVAALFMLVYGFGGVPLFRLMTSDPAVVDAGRGFLPWLLLMPAIGCPAFMWDGIFIGATASRHLRNSTLLCAIGFFAFWLAVSLLSPNARPETLLHILMGAYFIHLAIRSIYLTAVWPKLKGQLLF
ncbi:MAG: MATE family efflux transporter [Bacteroidales bacterium]|nr:MATE family efflux transporter [Bacteroidales bacterium]